MINKCKKRGFTLIETLVAILLLVTAISGPLTIASRSLSAAAGTKDQITAYYLAQDAVEYVRFARDTNKLKTLNWITGSPGPGGVDLSACVSSAGTSACYVDSIQSTISTCSGATCPNPLRYDATTGYFSYTTGTITSFRRSVVITNPLSGRPDEAQLAVTVSWSGANGISKSVFIQENIFNWQ